jgi:hypothetical protein
MDSIKSLAIIYTVLTLIIGVWFIDIWENDNTCSRVLPIVAYAEQGNFQLDKYHNKTMDISYVNNHYYMDKAPLPSAVVLPFFLIAKSLHIVQPINDSFYGKTSYILGGFICGTLPFLLMILMVVSQLRKTNREYLIPIAVTSFFASFIFVFSGTFFTHVFAGFLLVSAYYFLNTKRYLLAGLIIGLGFLSEYTLLWIAMIWALQLLYDKKYFLKFCIGFLPAIVLIMCYNFYFSGSPFTMLYRFVGDNFDVATKSSYGITYPKVEALFGLLFSFNRGLIFFFPMIIYMSWSLLIKITSSNTKSLFLSFIKHPVWAPFVFTIIFISAHAMWNGGYSYGPRHLLAIACLLQYAAVVNEEFATKYKNLLYGLLAFGLFCSVLSKITVVYSVPLFENFLPQYLLNEIKLENYNNGNWGSILNLLSPYSAAILFIGLLLMQVAAGIMLSKNLAKKRALFS